MANPYSRPVRYKYQPINVGVLAQPLAQQQAAYDQQTALIDNASFDIKALDSDSEVVKKKKEALQASLDEMSKDLLNTKDFRSASRKLAKLNKFYTTSDEIQSHQQNYAQYQQHKADLQKRVEKGRN
jgi:predicted  nucleic acid-binding Zn-ribbon protein